MYAARLDGLLALVESRLRNGLTNAASLRRTQALTASLPATITGFFGFERRLGTAARGTDFAFNLSKHGVEWVLGSDRWPRLSRFIEIWQKTFLGEAPDMWLEFDTSHDAGGSEMPNVFFALDRKCDSSIRRAFVSAAVENPESDGFRSHAVSALLERCVDACPETVTRLHVGFMAARPSPAVRICALSLTNGASLSFLQALGWKGSVDAVAIAIEPYRRLCDAFGLQIDVFDSVEAVVGIELLYDGNATATQPDCEPRWSSLFDQLVSDGICSAHERSALLRWVSQTSFAAPPLERVIAASSSSGELLLHGILRTGLSHIKLSFTAPATNGPSAKAYFGVTLENGPVP